MSGGRLAYPDAFKLIAIIGVVFAHLPPSRYTTEAWHTVAWTQNLLGWCVLGFFAVAGVLFRAGGGRSTREELVHRARRLLVPWLAFSLLYKAAVTLLAGVGVVQRANLPPADMSGALRWIVMPADPQLYFLVYLFLIQAACLLLAKLGVRAVLITGALVLAVWSVFLPYVGSNVEALHGARWLLLPLYFACFAFGLWAGRSAVRICLVAGGFAVAAGWIFAHGCTAAISWQLFAPWAVLLLMQLAGGTPAVKALAWLGRFTGGVYVWHAPLILGFVSILAVKVFGGGELAVFSTVIVTFVAAATLGSLVNRTSWLWFFRI